MDKARQQLPFEAWIIAREQRDLPTASTHTRSNCPHVLVVPRLIHVALKTLTLFLCHTVTLQLQALEIRKMAWFVR